MESKEEIIAHTRKWINDVVIGCNFCPFAAREFKNETILYEVALSENIGDCLEAFLSQCKILDENPGIETSFLIMPNAVKDFHAYLDLLGLAEELIEKEDYEGIYQVASFHPLYLFEGSTEDDPANYTNRSIYPMLHILREESVERALERFPDAASIPERNIRFAREKGLSEMKLLRS